MIKYKFPSHDSTTESNLFKNETLLCIANELAESNRLKRLELELIILERKFSNDHKTIWIDTLKEND